jgi:acetyl esterase
MSFKLCIPILFLGLIFNPALSAVSTPDADTQKIFNALVKLKAKSIDKLSPYEAKRQPTLEDAVQLVEANLKKPFSLERIEDRKMNVFMGKIDIRILVPIKGKNLPILVYYHPGGFVLGSINKYDGSAKLLAHESKAIVVSINYRKAPENKFPTAHHDAYDAYKWVLANAKSFGGDPNRIAVMGEGAGANLAINVAIKARDEKIQSPVHEVLFYPIVSTKMDSESYKQYANAKPLNKAIMAWFFDKYRLAPSDLLDHRLNLLKMDLKGLNPVTLVTAEIDPLKSEGVELFKALKRKNVAVSYKHFDELTHEFLGMYPVVRRASDALDLVKADLALAFAKKIDRSRQAQEARKRK